MRTSTAWKRPNETFGVFYPVKAASGNTEVGALPVTTVKGLYYQASWGSDLSNMRQGEKVQATGDTLYLGVIKQ